MSQEQPLDLPLAYDAGRIARWASFSGDYNPIHLDREAARKLGADDVIVHGMVPMMVAMQAADREVEALGDKEWVHCHIRLKRPVVKDELTQLSLKRMGAGTRFVVASARDGSLHLTGTLTVGDAPAPRTTEGGDYALSLEGFSLHGEQAKARAAALDDVLPEVSSPWVRLSAVLFSEIIRGQLPALKRATLSWAERHEVAQRESLVMQTTYSVSAHKRLLAEAASDPALTYQCVFDPAAVFRMNSDHVGDCWLRVLSGGASVMEVGVGLLLRFISDSTDQSS